MVARKGYKLTEVGEIPEDWEAHPLGRVAQICMCKRIFFSQTAINGDIPFYKIGTFGKQADAYISRDIYEEYKSKYSYPEKDDVLLSAAGTLGRTVIYDGSPAYFQDSNIVWLKIDKNQICNEYLYHYYQIIQWASPEGSTISRLYNSIILETVIKLPSATEQTAIATALSDADALIEALEQSITKKRHIKQGVMQELLTGKKRLPGFEGEWKEKLFCELAYPSRVRFTPSKKNIYDFCIELEHIEQCTGCLLNHTETTPESSLKSKFESGDILFGKLRAYLRKYWIATRSGVCSTEFWVLKHIAPYATPEYIHQLVQTDAFIEAASTAYGTHMPRSDWNVVKELEMKVPPLDEHGNPTEQTVIASVLSDMDEEIAALETKLAKAKQIKVGMMQELLTGRIRLI